MKYSIIIGVFCLAFCCTAVGQWPAQTLPQFSFTGQNKMAFTNKNLADSKYYFFAFVDADCDHCRQTIRGINRYHEKFKNTAIYLVSMSDEEKLNGLISQFGPELKSKKNVTILRDQKYEFLNKFKPRKFPGLYLYSKDGRLVIYEDNEQNLGRFLRQVNEQG